MASPLTAFTQNAKPHVLALFRIVTGLLFACHGASSLFGAFGGAMGDGGTVPVGSWPGWYAGVIELVGGALVMLGLGSRTAAFISSGSMAYAYFTVHQGEGLWPMQNGGESPALFCWAFLLLVFTGPGAWSLDKLFFGARAADRDQAPSATRREPSAA